MKLATSFNVADFGVRNPLIRSSTLSPTPGRLLSRDLGKRIAAVLVAAIRGERLTAAKAVIAAK